MTLRTLGRHTRTTPQHYRIHGIDVEAAGDVPEILGELGKELRFFASPPGAGARIHLFLVQDNDLDPANPVLEQRHRDPGDEIHWVREYAASVLNIPRRRLTLYVTEACPADAAAVILFGTLGFLVHLELAVQGPAAAFHAASLVRNGKGILLPGRTNSGKTSLSYLLQDAGFSYLSEEDSFLQAGPEGTVEILPYPRRIRLAPAVLDKQPRIWDLPFPKELVQSLDEKVFRIDPRGVPPRKVPLSHILILSNDIHQLGSSIAPLDRAEALFCLLSSLEVAKIHESPPEAREELKIHNRRAFDMAKSIVDSMPVNRLKYNILGDFSELPGIISDFMEAG